MSFDFFWNRGKEPIMKETMWDRIIHMDTYFDAKEREYAEKSLAKREELLEREERILIREYEIGAEKANAEYQRKLDEQATTSYHEKTLELTALDCEIATKKKLMESINSVAVELCAEKERTITTLKAVIDKLCVPLV